MGLALWQAGKTPEAISQWQQALHVQPDYAEAHGHLAIALEQTHSVREAIEHYEQALRVKPDYVMAQNNLAWLLATLAPAEGGDPVRAVGLAERACQLTSDRVAPYLDTLAAAYAATGRFTDAVTTAQAAVDLARSTGTGAGRQRNPDAVGTLSLGPRLSRAREWDEPAHSVTRPGYAPAIHHARNRRRK